MNDDAMLGYYELFLENCMVGIIKEPHPFEIIVLKVR